MSGYALAFALGMVFSYGFSKALVVFAKSSLGAKRGIRLSARRNWLAEMDHDDLLRLAVEIEAELTRRRS